jgi:microcystin-dependent protein
LVHRVARHFPAAQLKAAVPSQRYRGHTIMSSFYLGQITMFGFQFAPKGWALCNGQTLSIQQNTALFALFGTQFGGNGINNFNLPDLRARVPVCEGQGLGLSPYVIGQVGGVTSVTLLQNQIPQHNHTFNATKTSAKAATLPTNIPATPTVGSPPAFYAAQKSGGPQLTFVNLNPGACGTTGQSQPHNNMMPSQTINFCVALTGIFPSRN